MITSPGWAAPRALGLQMAIDAIFPFLLMHSDAPTLKGATYTNARPLGFVVEKLEITWPSIIALMFLCAPAICCCVELFLSPDSTRMRAGRFKTPVARLRETMHRLTMVRVLDEVGE